jgi:dipeptidyl aminopeptidase/acylaminoacyl peptidase
MKFKPTVVIVMLLSLLLAQNALANPGLDHYFKKPDFSQFQLSPNGKFIAGLAPVGDRQNIIVIDLETKKSQAVTAVSEQDVRGFQWATNNRLLFFMDDDGNESFGIWAVNKDGSQPRTLVQAATTRPGRIQSTNVLDLLEDEPDWVLVSSNDRRAAYPDVYRLNIISARKTVLHRNPGKITGWFTGWDGKVLGGAFTDKLEQGFVMLDEESGEWEEIVRTRYDAPSWTPALLSGDGVNGYINSNLTPEGEVRDKAALYRYNFETREMGEMIAEHAVVDCCAVGTTRATKDMISYSYNVGKPTTVYTDPKWKSIMDGINAALPDTQNFISSMDNDETIGVVVSTSSTQPATYYLYDFEERKLSYLADSRPWIKADEMAEMVPYEITARDGMQLHGYLTLPANGTDKNVPVVVNPHGGPWARDNWGYNPEIQFLANRGYAVLQVNFRGSTGFGMNHLLSSNRQWGQAMQNDITDAVQWLVDEGIGDKNRICIYGGSYGGYATMAGLTYTPDLYQCGINYVGVTDLNLLFKSLPDAWGAAAVQFQDRVGDPKTEKEFLEEWSPSNHADKIKVPVFMAYGRRDPRVVIDHANVMEKALKKNGVKYELMVKGDEGHGFRKQENVYDFYGKMESFLAENLNP